MQLKIQITGQIKRTAFYPVKKVLINSIIQHCLECEVYPHADTGDCRWMERTMADKTRWAEMLNCFRETILELFEDSSCSGAAHASEAVRWPPDKITCCVDGKPLTNLPSEYAGRTIEKKALNRLAHALQPGYLLMLTDYRSIYSSSVCYAWNNIGSQFRPELIAIKIECFSRITGMSDLRAADITYNGANSDSCNSTGFAAEDFDLVFISKTGAQHLITDLIREYLNNANTFIQ